MLSWLKKYRYTALLYRIIQLSFKGNYWGGEGGGEYKPWYLFKNSMSSRLCCTCFAHAPFY
jgi:hypothetical protein